MSKSITEKMRAALHEGRYSVDTERAYMGWCERYSKFLGDRRAEDVGVEAVAGFLAELEKKRPISPSTRNQALNAFSFLYKNVLGKDLGSLDGLRAVRPARLPVVLTTEEVRAVLSAMRGTAAVQAGMLYGCGLRIKECLRLRVQDLDLKAGVVVIRGTEGGKDRVINLPERLKTQLEGQLQYAHTLYDADIAGKVELPPPPVSESSAPGLATTGWEAYWVFPSDSLSTDAKGRTRRNHSVDVTLSRAIGRAAKLARVSKKVTAHTFRHSFATHLLLRGVNIKAVQEALGHANVQTTEVYSQVVQAMQGAIRSPLDDL